jgi:hypothetical protein
MDDNHAFSAITDFDALRWQLPNIIVGNGPDARTCRFLFRSRIRHCHLSQGFIEFENSRSFYPQRNCLDDGTPAYLFPPYRITEIYCRRTAEYAIEGYFGTPTEDSRTVAELILEAAGSPRTLSWIPQEALWSQVESHLINVGLPQLKQLVDLIASLRPAAVEPLNALAIAG